MDGTTKKCPLCANEIKAEAVICRFCGAGFEVAVRGYCSNCHAEMDLDANDRCSRCGNPSMDRHIESRLVKKPLPSSPQSAFVRPPPPPPVYYPTTPVYPPVTSAPPGKRSYAWGWVLGIALMVTGLILVCIILNSPKTVTPTSVQRPLATSTRLPTSTPRPTRTPAPTPTPTPVEVTFDTLGDYPVGRLVVLVGRLEMFGSTYCNHTCGLLLENPSNTAQDITIFVVQAGEGVEPAPNQMKHLPNSFTKSDIQVRLDDGTYAVIGYRITVTGRVCHTESGEACISDIIKIELWQLK